MARFVACVLLSSTLVVVAVMTLWIAVLEDDGSVQEVLAAPKDLARGADSKSLNKAYQSIGKRVSSSPYMMNSATQQNQKNKKRTNHHDHSLEAPSKSMYFTFPSTAKHHAVNTEKDKKKSGYAVSRSKASTTTRLSSDHGTPRGHSNGLIKDSKRRAETQGKTQNKENGKGREKVPQIAKAKAHKKRVWHHKLQVSINKNQTQKAAGLVIVKGPFKRYVKQMQHKLKQEKKKTKHAVQENHNKMNALAQQYRAAIAKQKKRMAKIQERSKKKVARLHTAAVHLAKQINARAALAEAAAHKKAALAVGQHQKTPGKKKARKQQKDGVQFSKDTKSLHAAETLWSDTKQLKTVKTEAKAQHIVQSYKSELNTASSAVKRIENEAEQLSKNAHRLQADSSI